MAQRARGLAGMKRLTAAKALWLADHGMLKRMPYEAPPVAPIVAPRLIAATVQAPVLAPAPILVPAPTRRVYLPTDPKPARWDYRSHEEWIVEYLAWVRIQDAAGLRSVAFDVDDE
jgi:hypothetical protein